MKTSALITTADTALRLKDVLSYTGLSRSTIYNKINCKSKQYDPDFPRPFHVGIKAIAWSNLQIQAWITKRKEALTFSNKTNQ